VNGHGIGIIRGGIRMFCDVLALIGIGRIIQIIGIKGEIIGVLVPGDKGKDESSRDEIESRKKTISF